ncbi:MAG: hypothetical protein WCH39_11065 [Schlesneria sp.]
MDSLEYSDPTFSITAKRLKQAAVAQTTAARKSGFNRIPQILLVKEPVTTGLLINIL